MKFLALLPSLLFFLNAHAQTFVSYPNATVPVFGGSTYDDFPINVFGITPTTFIENGFSVKVNIQHASVEDLTLVLMGPGGTADQTFLHSYFVGTGANFVNTVFSMAGTENTYSNATPPFTGVFLPLYGNFDEQNGSAVNGTWKLRITNVPQSGGGDNAVLQNWSITFNNDPTVIGATSLPAQQNQLARRVYPNPAQDWIRVDAVFNLQAAIVTITDRFGRVVYNATTGANGINVDVSGWPNGLYALTLTDLDGEILTQSPFAVLHQ